MERIPVKYKQFNHKGELVALNGFLVSFGTMYIDNPGGHPGMCSSAIVMRPDGSLFSCYPEEITIIGELRTILVNGRLCTQINVVATSTQDIAEAAERNPEVMAAIAGREIKKVIRANENFINIVTQPSDTAEQ